MKRIMMMVCASALALETGHCALVLWTDDSGDGKLENGNNWFSEDGNWTPGNPPGTPTSPPSNSTSSMRISS